MNKLNTALLAGAVAGLVAGVAITKDASADHHEKADAKGEKHECKGKDKCKGKKKKPAEAAAEEHKGEEAHGH